jgi:nicotinamidase-related amidase
VLNTQQVVICGIEAHICVLQTAFDLKMAGFDVFLVNEAIGSRRQEDKDLAIERARDYGIHLVNFEMVLFELIRDSNHQDFKELSALISK